MARDGFSKLLAAGLTAVFAIQAVVIIGGVVQVDPADRRDPAVHQLRRQLGDRQHGPARAAADDLQRRAPPAGRSREPGRDLEALPA